MGSGPYAADAAAVPRPAVPVHRYGQAVAVAIGFYLAGHLMDLIATMGRVGLGQLPEGPLSALAWAHYGMLGLVTLKVIGSAATAWAFWHYRDHKLALIVTCGLAVLLLYSGSLNLLMLLEALW